MSYITDVEEQNGLCRVYGYLDENGSFESLAKNGMRCDWFTKDQMQNMLNDGHHIPSTIHTWQRDDIIRGKGKACNQSKHQFD
jgi:hypothetical protein